MRNIVIAGGTNGIGLELSKRLMHENNIYVLARNRHNLPLDDKIIFIGHDFNTNHSLPSIDIEIDALVYAPGSINLKPFKTLKIEDFESDLQINLLGAIKFIQHYLPKLNKQNASILLFSTVAVNTGMAYHTSIAAAKGALEAFSRSLAAELAPTVRVNCIAPSLTHTALSEKLISNKVRLKAAEERHPLKRIEQAHDVAACAEWLISDEAKFITAQTFHLDDGISRIK
jgi:NAD(P)-dependent dehydrogenase (short-subunit alcohol dehydrogenase family)